MKHIFYIFCLLLVVAGTSCTRNYYSGKGPYDDQYGYDYDDDDEYRNYDDYEDNDYGYRDDEVDINIFYNQLSPYGNWIQYPGYGRVWIPHVQGFRPYYSNGHWMYSQFGWTWVSNYSWGWAPFHYGRWMHDFRHGWLWVPGSVWAPAWVQWRGGGGYYGWCAMGPRGYYSSNYNNWHFVPAQYMGSPRMNHYYVNNAQNIYRKTSMIDYSNKPYNPGPRIGDVERVSKRKIAPVRVFAKTNPGNTEIKDGTISIYKPENIKQHISPENKRMFPGNNTNTNQDNNNRKGNVRTFDNNRESNHKSPAGTETQKPDLPNRKWEPVNDRVFQQSPQHERQQIQKIKEQPQERTAPERRFDKRPTAPPQPPQHNREIQKMQEQPQRRTTPVRRFDERPTAPPQSPQQHRQPVRQERKVKPPLPPPKVERQEKAPVHKSPVQAPRRTFPKDD